MADPQQIIQSQTSIPDYARAQVERMLGATEGAIYDYQRDAQGNLVKDASGAPIVTGLKPYQTYTQQRLLGQTYLASKHIKESLGWGWERKRVIRSRTCTTWPHRPVHLRITQQHMAISMQRRGLINRGSLATKE